MQHLILSEHALKRWDKVSPVFVLVIVIKIIMCLPNHCLCHSKLDEVQCYFCKEKV